MKGNIKSAVTGILLFLLGGLVYGLTINTNLSNTILYLKNLFITSDGTPSGQVKLKLDGSNGNIVLSGSIKAGSDIYARGKKLANEDYVQTKASEAEQNAKNYADTKASEAEQNAKNYANTKASEAEQNAKNYVDAHIVSFEKPIRIGDTCYTLHQCNIDFLNCKDIVTGKTCVTDIEDKDRDGGAAKNFANVIRNHGDGNGTYHVMSSEELFDYFQETHGRMNCDFSYVRLGRTTRRPWFFATYSDEGGFYGGREGTNCNKSYISSNGVGLSCDKSKYFENRHMHFKGKCYYYFE